jgi:hypothetical protein
MGKLNESTYFWRTTSALCIGGSDELVELVGHRPVQLQPAEEFSDGLQSIRVDERQQPTTPHFVTQGYYGTYPSAMGFMKSWQDQLEIARTHLTNTTNIIK